MTAKVKYLQKCNAENLSLKTLKSYDYHVTNFINFANKVDCVKAENVGTEHIVGYLNYLHKRKYSPITVKDRFIAVKMFFAFLVASGVLPVSPADGFKTPKVEKRIIYSFEKQEVNYILNSFDKSTFIGFRNYTITSVLFSTGIRKSELLNLTLFDTRHEVDSLRIIGKGNKERLVPVSPALKRILTKYSKLRQDYLQSHGKDNIAYLFISKDGRHFSPGGLNTVFRHIKELKPLWSTRVSPHTFRHTFAKFFLLNGGDIFTLQKILGHEDIATTKLYIDLNETEVKIQNEKFNPLDNSRWQYY